LTSLFTSHCYLGLKPNKKQTKTKAKKQMLKQTNAKAKNKNKKGVLFINTFLAGVFN